MVLRGRVRMVVAVVSMGCSGGCDDDGGGVGIVMMLMSWWCGGVCVSGRRGRANGGGWPEAAPKMGEKKGAKGPIPENLCLDRNDFDHGQQALNGNFWEGQYVEGTEGALHLGLERPRVYSDLSPEDKERGMWDSIWISCYAYLKQHEARANENKMMLDRFTQHTVDPLALMSNGQQNRGQGSNARGAGEAGYRGAQNIVGNANPGQARQGLCPLNVDNVFQADDYDAFDFDVDEAPMATAVFMANLHLQNPDAVCEHLKNTEMHAPIITPTGLTEGERGFEQTKECYLTEVIPFFKTLKENFEGIQKALIKEIKEMKDIFEELEAEVDQNVVNRKHDEIERKNLLIVNDNLIANCLSKEVFYIATNSELIVSRFTEMHEAHTIVQTRCLELEA
ncbi:hypothetical protein Tco_0584496 [Tanacetum coccineum]